MSEKLCDEVERIVPLKVTMANGMELVCKALSKAFGWKMQR